MVYLDPLYLDLLVLHYYTRRLSRFLHIHACAQAITHAPPPMKIRDKDSI